MTYMRIDGGEKTDIAQCLLVIWNMWNNATTLCGR